MTKPRKTDTTDRTTPYRDWHRTWAPTDYVHDIDQLEWRIVDGKRVYVALIELTAIMPYHKMPDALDAIIKRVGKVQGDVMVDVAQALDVPALVVAFTHDLGDFYVYSLTSDKRWHHTDRTTYRRWIDTLARRKMAIHRRLQSIQSGPQDERGVGVGTGQTSSECRAAAQVSQDAAFQEVEGRGAINTRKVPGMPQNTQEHN
jgi:hypothetical protein